jgi:uncharacterized protein YecT (DUF1311 family)
MKSLTLAITALIFTATAQINAQSRNLEVLDSVYCFEINSIDELRDSLMSLEPNQTSRFGYSNYGMKNIMDTCEYELDKLLNKYYQLLSKDLTTSAFRVVRDSQRIWLQFRESYLKAYSETLPDDGTMWELYYRGKRVELLEIRIGELFDLLRSLVRIEDGYKVIEYPQIRIVGFYVESIHSPKCGFTDTIINW